MTALRRAIINHIDIFQLLESVSVLFSSFVFIYVVSIVSSDVLQLLRIQS